MKNKVIVITGATGSGKSHYALSLAEKINGEIINSDAMQVYKDVTILSASPVLDSHIKHRLYNFVNNGSDFSVQMWLDLLGTEVNSIIAQGKVPIIIGGTPMYNRILIDGINNVPEISCNIKNKTQNMHLNEIYDDLIKLDPLSKNIDPKNTHRIIRAYQVFLQTGTSIYDFHSKPKKCFLSGFDIKKILIYRSKEDLYKICAERFNKMIATGAIDEVIDLYRKGYDERATIFKIIGVREIKQYLDEKISLSDALDLSILHTRQYIKKQNTWFNNKFQDFDLLSI